MASNENIRRWSLSYGQSLSQEQRISVLVDQAGGPTKVGKTLGVTRETVSNWGTGKSRPPMIEIAKLADQMGISMDWVVGAWAQLKAKENAVANQDDFALVKELDVLASAGAGALNHESQTGLVSFRRDWLRDRGINPNAATVISAWGDSMEPTIRSGDTLLVDNSIDRIRDEGIYVLVVNGLTLVKRLMMKTNGDLKLSSDNPQYDSETIKKKDLSDLHVAGRVMWFGRSI